MFCYLSTAHTHLNLLSSFLLQWFSVCIFPLSLAFVSYLTSISFLLHHPSVKQRERNNWLLGTESTGTSLLSHQLTHKFKFHGCPCCLVVYSPSLGPGSETQTYTRTILSSSSVSTEYGWHKVEDHSMTNLNPYKIQLIKNLQTASELCIVLHA